MEEYFKGSLSVQDEHEENMPRTSCQQDNKHVSMAEWEKRLGLRIIEHEGECLVHWFPLPTEKREGVYFKELAYWFCSKST